MNHTVSRQRTPLREQVGEKRQTVFPCGKRIGADSRLQGIQRGGRLGFAGGLLTPFEVTA